MASSAIPISVRRRYAVAMVGVLAILAALVGSGWPALDRIDLNVEVAARALVLDHPALLSSALFITHAGDPLTINIVVGVGMAIFLLFRRPDAALVLLIARVGAGVSVTVMKWLLERGRPVWETPIAVASGFSFPSGHSAGSAAVYGTLALLAWAFLPRVARPVTAVAAGLLILAVASSRVLIGVHYLSDVVAGMLLGFTWMLAALVLVTRLWPRRRPGKPTVVAQEDVAAKEDRADSPAP